METKTAKLTIYKSPYFRKGDDELITQIELNRYLDSLEKLVELGLVYQIVEVDEEIYNVCDVAGTILLDKLPINKINEWFH